MKVFVVMGNDCPDSVWASEAEAERFVQAKMDAQRKVHADDDARFGRKTHYTPRVFWRVHAFTLCCPAKVGDAA